MNNRLDDYTLRLAGVEPKEDSFIIRFNNFFKEVVKEVFKSLNEL